MITIRKFIDTLRYLGIKPDKNTVKDKFSLLERGDLFTIIKREAKIKTSAYDEPIILNLTKMRFGKIHSVHHQSIIRGSEEI